MAGGLLRGGGDQRNPLLAALGYAGAPGHPGDFTSSANPSSQNIYAMAVWLPAGATISNVVVNVATVPTGTLPTGVFAGLADSTGKMLAQSGNLNALSNFPAVGPVALPLSAPYVTTYSGLHYVVFLINGVYGTINLGLNWRTGNTNGAVTLGSNPRPWGFQSGQTVLPANGSSFALSNTIANPFLAAS